MMREEKIDKTTNLLFEDPHSKCKTSISFCQESPLNAASSGWGHALSKYQLIQIKKLSSSKDCLTRKGVDGTETRGPR